MASHRVTWFILLYKTESLSFCTFLSNVLHSVPQFSVTLIQLFILQVKVVCETRDIEHAKILKKTLYKNYKTVIFGEIPSPTLLGAEDVTQDHVWVEHDNVCTSNNYLWISFNSLKQKLISITFKYLFSYPSATPPSVSPHLHHCVFRVIKNKINIIRYTFVSFTK
jgi:hypothetical protein